MTQIRTTTRRGRKSMETILKEHEKVHEEMVARAEAATRRRLALNEDKRAGPKGSGKVATKDVSIAGRSLAGAEVRVRVRSDI